MSLLATRTLTAGPVVLDLEMRTCIIDGQRSVDLPVREWTLLATLMENPMRAVPRGELQRRAWPEGYPSATSRSLDTAMGRLRHRLGFDGFGRTEYLSAVRGVGYRFMPAAAAAIEQGDRTADAIDEGSFVARIRSQAPTVIAGAMLFGRQLMIGDRATLRAGYTWKSAFLAAIEVFGELSELERVELGTFLHGFSRGLQHGDLVCPGFADGYHQGWLVDPDTAMPAGTRVQA